MEEGSTQEPRAPLAAGAHTAETFPYGTLIFVPCGEGKSPNRRPLAALRILFQRR